MATKVIQKTCYYITFALIATVANIVAQETVIRFNAENLILSVIVGTLIGLWVKYVLDKKYIFQFKSQNVSQDTIKFLFYSLMGVLTTLIFWTVEFGFHYFFETKFWRYVGAVIGLAIGYTIKYFLDRRFVFVD